MTKTSLAARDSGTFGSGSAISEAHAAIEARLAPGASNAFRSTETQFHDLLEILPDAVYVHRDGKIVYANSAGIRLCGGAGPEDIFGRPTFTFIPADQRRMVEARLDETLARDLRVPLMEQQWVPLDGGMIDVEVTATPCVWEGERSLLVVCREIGERKRTEAALRETEARLQSINANLPGMVYQRVRHPDGRVEFPFVSAGVRLVLGVEPDAAMDDPAVLLDLIHPDDRESYRGSVRRSAETGEQLDIEFRVIDPAGRTRWVRGISRPRRRDDNAIVWDSLMFDITARKAVERALQRSETRYRRFLETSPDAIYVHVEDRIVYANDAAAAMFGAPSADALVGREATTLFDTEALDLLSEMRERIRAEGRIAETTEFRLRRLDDSHFYGEATASTVDWDGEPAISVNIRDVSGRHAAKALMERLNRKLLEQTRELQRSNADLEQFAYIASHDLQEPLRMVSGYCQLLQRRYKDRLDDDANEFIEYAVDGARRMQRLISDILTYSRVGTRSGDMAPVDVGEAFDETVANLKAAIDAAGATVTCDALPVVEADRSQIGQLLQNLIGNALKFRGTAPARIHCGVRDLGTEWEFTVSDNGIGIAPEYRDRIFLIFQRLHNRSEYPGTGIGLAVCQKIVNRHGGAIRVESGAGGGSKFVFTIAKAED